MIRTTLWSDEPGDLIIHLIWKDDWDKVPDGTLLAGINETTVIKGKDNIDLDHRSGYLAVGFVEETFAVDGDEMDYIVHRNPVVSPDWPPAHWNVDTSDDTDPASFR